VLQKLDLLQRVKKDGRSQFHQKHTHHIIYRSKAHITGTMLRLGIAAFALTWAHATVQHPEGMRAQLNRNLNDPLTIQREWQQFIDSMGADHNDTLGEAISVANAGMPIQALAMFRYAATLRRDSAAAMNLAVTELKAGHLRRAYTLMLWALHTDPDSDIIQENWDNLFGRSSSLPASITDADLLTLNEELRAGLRFNTTAMFDHIPTKEDIIGIRELAAVDTNQLSRLQPPEFRPLPRFTPAQLAQPQNAAFAAGRRAFVLTGIFAPPSLENPGTPLPHPQPLLSATGIVNQFAANHGRDLSPRSRRAGFFSKHRKRELLDTALFRHSLWTRQSHADDSTIREAVKHMRVAARQTATKWVPYALWSPDPVAWDTIWEKLNLTHRLPALFQNDRAWLGPAMTAAGSVGWQRTVRELRGGLGRPGPTKRDATEASELANEFTDSVRWRLAPIGPGGAGMFLHFDGIHLASWQLQLAGRKTWVICPGSEAQRLYDIGVWHHMRPAWDTVPLVKIAHCFNTTLYPGEAVYYPKGYFHGTYNHAAQGTQWDADDGLVVSFSGSAVTADSTHRIQAILTRECETRAKVNMTEQLADFTTGGGRVKVLKKAPMSTGTMHGIPSKALCVALRDHLFLWWTSALHGSWVPGHSVRTCADGVPRGRARAHDEGSRENDAIDAEGQEDVEDEEWNELEPWGAGVGG
jgi:hypothetical protein